MTHSNRTFKLLFNMAIIIQRKPTTNYLTSTLVPLVFQVFESTADTTNIVARCYKQNQSTGVETSLGGKFRLANVPNVNYTYKFDASEVFNNLTKYTLFDFPNNQKLGNNSGAPNLYKVWKDVASFKVVVKFQREYLDATTGLIVLDPTEVPSGVFYVHEGVPDRRWLTQQVRSNGTGGSIFDFFQFKYESDVRRKRWFTNYPIKKNGSDYQSFVNIHEDEQYMLMFYGNQQGVGQIRIRTYDSLNGQGVGLGTHVINTTSSEKNVATTCVGFRDIVKGFTPNPISEGANFSNVVSYTIDYLVNAGGGVSDNQATEYVFNVDRGCLKNKGYLRFCFKNSMGGYDMVSSLGKFKEGTKNKFQNFEQTLGYDNWNNAMAFGNSNWANESITEYSVTTQHMKPEYAKHFSEMFSSTQVYLRVPNDGYLQVSNNEIAISNLEQPYYFVPIVITPATAVFEETTDNLTQLKFKFTRAVNPRQPRY